ncbi:MAG TPA: hypothetical protein PK280_03600 [Planctomycetota bacterium]|nr:hypothetical protein [Planctomycetota bacterium]
MGRDPVARGFLAVLCEAKGFLVAEADTASAAGAYREAGPFFSCRVGVRQFFSRCAALLQELAATRLQTLVLMVGDADDESPAELETAEAVTVMASPSEDEAITRILTALAGARGGQPGC